LGGGSLPLSGYRLRKAQLFFGDTPLPPLKAHIKIRQFYDFIVLQTYFYVITRKTTTLTRYRPEGAAAYWLKANRRFGGDFPRETTPNKTNRSFQNTSKQTETFVNNFFY